MLNILWACLLIIGIITAAFTGNLEAVNNSILESTQDAVELLIVMTGIISMWNGFLVIAEESGITKQLTRYMCPFLRLLFPHLPPSHPAFDYICANFIANILGLGWACTPTGLAAMKQLQLLQQQRGRSPDIASDEMCTFLILNISSLQLIPMNMIAYRSKYGSTTPFSIIVPALIATTMTTLIACILCRILQNRKDSP